MKFHEWQRLEENSSKRVERFVILTFRAMHSDSGKRYYNVARYSDLTLSHKTNLRNGTIVIETKFIPSGNYMAR